MRTNGRLNIEFAKETVFISVVKFDNFNDADIEKYRPQTPNLPVSSQIEEEDSQLCEINN